MRFRDLVQDGTTTRTHDRLYHQDNKASTRLTQQVTMTMGWTSNSLQRMCLGTRCLPNRWQLNEFVRCGSAQLLALHVRRNLASTSTHAAGKTWTVYPLPLPLSSLAAFGALPNVQSHASWVTCPCDPFAIEALHDTSFSHRSDRQNDSEVRHVLLRLLWADTHVALEDGQLGREVASVVDGQSPGVHQSIHQCDTDPVPHPRRT